jgi:hypothetical protein
MLNDMEMDRSLRGNIDATDKINDIRLSLNSDAGRKIIWILVEGEDDCRIYPKFFDERKTKVEFVNGGKGQLVIALNTLTQETDQVIGIQDADFLHLERSYPAVENLFYTDYHDIEITMLNFEDVRYNLLTEYGLQDKSAEIWQNVLNEASHVAYVRWYNDKNRCKIIFSGLGLGTFVGLENAKVRLKNEELLCELNTRSSNKTETLTLANMDSFKAENQTTDLLNLCNGHDVTALIALIVGGQVSHREFCRHLRLSFHAYHFANTKLYAKIYAWQNESGYTILKNVA